MSMDPAQPLSQDELIATQTMTQDEPEPTAPEPYHQEREDRDGDTCVSIQWHHIVCLSAAIDNVIVMGENLNVRALHHATERLRQAARVALPLISREPRIVRRHEEQARRTMRVRIASPSPELNFERTAKQHRHE